MDTRRPVQRRAQQALGRTHVAPALHGDVQHHPGLVEDRSGWDDRPARPFVLPVVRVRLLSADIEAVSKRRAGQQTWSRDGEHSENQRRPANKRGSAAAARPPARRGRHAGSRARRARHTGQVTLSPGGSAHLDPAPGSAAQRAGRQWGVTAWKTGACPFGIRPPLRSATNTRVRRMMALGGKDRRCITPLVVQQDAAGKVHTVQRPWTGRRRGEPRTVASPPRRGPVPPPGGQDAARYYKPETTPLRDPTTYAIPP